MKIITIDSIVKYIEDNLESSRIDIDSLVKYTGYSRRYIQLLFKEYTFLTLGRYIQLRRISRAAMYLKLTTVSIVHISDTLLYDSQQTFTREFKKITGFTPKNYRDNKLWNFRNMTGIRMASSCLIIPEIIFLNELKVKSSLLTFNEKLFPKENRRVKKWNVVENIVTAMNIGVTFSHLIKSNKNNIVIDLYVWDLNEKPIIDIVIKAGFYASFKYEGTIDNYIQFTNDIYLTILPFYHLHKDDSFDIETIKKVGDGLYQFEYFIPIL